MQKQETNLKEQPVFTLRQNLPEHLKMPERISKASKELAAKFVDGQWEQLKMNEIAPYIKIWNTKSMIYLNKNKQASILKQISSTYFTYLDQFYIADNLIQTIDGLIELRAPLLQVIWVQDNLIRSLKPLKRIKQNLPHLAYIQVTQNYLVDGMELSELQISFPMSLSLQYNKSGRVQYEDLSPLAKLKSDERYSDEKFLNFCSTYRIRQLNVIRCLQQKVHNLYTRFTHY